MKVLGIESTAHTLGIGIIEYKDKKLKILKNYLKSYKPKEGIIPTEAAEFHKKSLENFTIDEEDIDLIGVAIGPGLPPCLSVGLEFALKFSKGKKIIGVNHCQSHIEIGKVLTKSVDPVILYVSGGNTQVIYYNKGYRILGETQDIGIGNAIDKLGREIGLKFPAGPKIEKLSKKGKFVMLPYSVKGMDLNFSGILTEAKKKLKTEKIEDICHSFQEICFAMLTEVTERGLGATGRDEVLLVGGVAQNKRLREMLKIMCEDRSAKFKVVPKKYSGDNGVMIAYTALRNYLNKCFHPADKIRPNWRIEGIL
ncbi:MAG: UGMP family protein [Candidatus Aenigmarchaeota archaeon ex4484_56]|nr:MAG: UGMP family protein [Candidatus Aenigmarchaeota archaeon ex4484_56]